MKAVRRRFQTLFQKTDACSEYDHYRHLNLDVLLIIFSYINIKTLALCAAVCKNWKEAAYHPSLWKGVTASISADQHVNSLTAESFGERNITSYRIYLADMDTCSNPEDRYGDRISAQLTVLSRSVNIESLVITSESADAKEDANGDHGKTPPMLHTIKLCSDLAKANLKYLAMVLRNGCPQLSLDSSGYQFTTLRQLSLCSSSVNQTYCVSEFYFFENLFSAFPNLIDLELSGVYCSALFDRAPRTINHNLERLALMQDDRMAGNTLINNISVISYRFPNLLHLDMEFHHWEGWTPALLPMLSFPLLESLILTSSRRLYDHSIVIANLFTNSPKLTALEIGFADYLDRKRLFERNIGKVLEFFPKLTLLRLQNRASDPGIFDQSESLVKIVRTMTQLDTLVLLGSWRLSEPQLRTICDTSSYLSRLVVSWDEWETNFPADLGEKAPWKQNYPVMHRRQNKNWEVTREFSESRNEIFGTKHFHTSQSKVLLCSSHLSRACVIWGDGDCRFSHVEMTGCPK